MWMYAKLPHWKMGDRVNFPNPKSMTGIGWGIILDVHTTSHEALYKIKYERWKSMGMPDGFHYESTLSDW